MSVVYTVGYEATDIDRFVATLKAAGVARVADVRAVAVSRKKGFSKTRLSERLSDEGIEYLHLIDLGDPKDGRDAARAGQFDKFREIYAAHFATSKAQEALATLTSYASHRATSLLCFERDPSTCHRTIVAEAVGSKLGWSIFHLFADEPQKYVRHASSMPRFHPCESLAPAE